jgi:hypothetical protein
MMRKLLFAALLAILPATVWGQGVMKGWDYTNGRTRTLSVDSSGQLYIVTPSGVPLAVVEASAADILTATEAIQTAAELIDDTVYLDGGTFTPATSKLLGVGFEVDELTPASVAEGKIGAARMSPRRSVHMEIRDGQGNERSAYVNASGQVLVLEGNSAAALTALQIIDDWDESDRAKVNPIAGQAGVAAGAGAVDALTQRTTLASDDPAVALLGTIDTDTGVIAGDTTSIDGKTPALGVAASAGSVPVVLASDDAHLGAVGAAADVDGNVHGQLRYIGEAAAATQTATEILDNMVFVDDAVFTDDTSSIAVVGGWYQSVQQTITDGSVGPIQVDQKGNAFAHKIDTTGVSPPKTTTATIGAATIDIFASTDVITIPNWCIYIHNTDAGDPFTALDIDTSPDETTWVEITQTDCSNTLAATTLCVYCVSGSAYRYIRVQAAAAAGPNEASSDVWLVGNKG